MLDERIKYLLNSYLEGTSSPEEERELSNVIKELDDDTIGSLLQTYWNEFQPSHDVSTARGQEMLQNILAAPRNPAQKRPKTVRIFRIASSAAAAAVIIFACTYLYNRFSVDNKSLNANRSAVIQYNQRTPYTRRIQLPDQTIVILKSGSTLKVLTGFNGSKRVVSLIGEAYFDVHHDNKRPFIIRSGNVKTTVLGTAFDIRAWPAEHNVVVSVTRGKVKVEDPVHLLGILTANQQLHSGSDQQHMIHKTIDVDKDVLGWAQKDLIFRDQPLSEVADILSKRFGVTIVISDPKLRESLMVSSFSKTEELNNILDIICTLNVGTKYVNQGNVITIMRK